MTDLATTTRPTTQDRSRAVTGAGQTTSVAAADADHRAAGHVQHGGRGRPAGEDVTGGRDAFVSSQQRYAGQRRPAATGAGAITPQRYVYLENALMSREMDRL